MLAQGNERHLARDLRAAFRHLRQQVPVGEIARLIRHGHMAGVADAAGLGHFSEVLKEPFQRLGEIWNKGADIAADRINADFRRAGKRVRYRPRRLAKYDPVPVVPVTHQTDLYFVWNKSDFFRAHETANYRQALSAQRCCGVCSMFQAPHSCVEVDDPIAVDGVCDYFEPLDVSKFNPDQPRDERGRWSGGEGGGRGPGSTTVSVGGREVTAELSPVSRAVGDRLVVIDAAAFDRQFARDTNFYVGPQGGGSGGVAGRYGGFQDYLAGHDSFQASEVGVQADGSVSFTNGRHRYAVLRDAGVRGIPVAMDRQSIAHARRHGYLMGVVKGQVAKAIGDGFDFDLLDEATQKALREAQDELIAQLDASARDAIEAAIVAGVNAGDRPEEIANAIRDSISLTDRQAQAVANYRALLEDLDSGALNRALRNIEFDAAVEDAIDSGEFLSAEAIDRMVEDYADNFLDYRADTIARTESLRAANQGLRDGYRQAADRGVFPAEAVRRFWEIATDERVCPVCQSIAERNPDGVGLDEDFESEDGPIDDAPVHPRCRCTTRYETNLDMLPEDEDEDEEAAA